jgi:hypothetical protein
MQAQVLGPLPICLTISTFYPTNPLPVGRPVPGSSNKEEADIDNKQNDQKGKVNQEIRRKRLEADGQ